MHIEKKRKAHFDVGKSLNGFVLKSGSFACFCCVCGENSRPQYLQFEVFRFSSSFLCHPEVYTSDSCLTIDRQHHYLVHHQSQGHIQSVSGSYNPHLPRVNIFHLVPTFSQQKHNLFGKL